MERKATYYSAWAVLTLAMIAIMVACGPATQSSGGDHPDGQRVAQTDSQEATPAPTPTPPTFEKYPNLDEVLVGVVDKYESGELTEREAAKQAPLHRDDTVLVEVDALAAQIDALDEWMGEQGIEPRFKDADHYMTPHIYAYVRVSVLGTLSNREGVVVVWHVEGVGESPIPDGVLGQEGPSDPPTLPYWLKDGEYSRLESPLNALIYDYENGTITAQDVLNNRVINHAVLNNALYVMADVRDLSKIKAVNEWLKSREGVFQARIEGDNVAAYVPVPHILGLSRRPGVGWVYVPEDPLSRLDMIGPRGRGSRDYQPDSHQRRPPTPTPTPKPTTTSQGVSQHGATAWHIATPTKYTGKGVKVGIIDAGFIGFSTLIGNELPSADRIRYRCYSISNGGASPSSQNSQCVMNSRHGTRIAEILADVAPDVELYISNSGGIRDLDINHRRVKEDVTWMIREGVDVISHSMGSGFSEGLGDGVPAYDTVTEAARKQHPLDSIKAATDAGILWVNSVGNNHGRIWRGTFQDLDGDKNLDFARNDERMYITLKSDAGVTAQMRWDDDWGTSKCDLDLHIMREIGQRSSTAGIGVKSQVGRSGDIPYERASAGQHYADNPNVTEKFYIQVVRQEHQRLPGTPDPCMNVDWIQLFVDRPHVPEQTTGYSTNIQSTSLEPGLLATGAASHLSPTVIEKYSGRGPTSDGRTKPDVVGTTCVETKIHLGEIDPDTGIYTPGSQCWFAGTSAAAPHIAGLAALVIQKYDNPAAREFEARDVADWIKDYAVQRISSPDPNNTWGHGFAKLPATAPEASLTVTSGAIPTTMTWGTSQTFTITASNVGTAGVDVRLNREGEDGSLTLTSTSSTACTWEDDYSGTRGSTQYTFTVKACASGDTNIRLYRANTDTLLAVYPIGITSTAQTSSAKSL